MLWRRRLTRRVALQRGAALAALARAHPSLFAQRGPAAASRQQEVDPPGWEAVSARLQAAVDGGEVDGAGLVAVSATQTLYLRAFGRYGVDSVDLIASATKQPSACTLMALVDDGAVALDDPVARYLPEFAGAKAAITLRQCLSHTSGLPSMAPELSDDTITLAEAVRRYARLPLVAAPGTRFVYGGVSYSVAGRVAEVVSGMDW
ncbi:MAG TPA: serine hydrolase domain-containing protein [Dehalococcoidia bacterium]|nr:serine hydrolase domain-containing protein [Dehalococcoidia bacterium]